MAAWGQERANPAGYPQETRIRGAKTPPPDAPLGRFKCRFLMCMPWPVFMYVPTSWIGEWKASRMAHRTGQLEHPKAPGACGTGRLRQLDGFTVGLHILAGGAKKLLKTVTPPLSFRLSSSFLHHAGTFRLDLLLFIRFSPLGPVPFFFFFIHTPYLLACGTAEEHHIPFPKKQLHLCVQIV